MSFLVPIFRGLGSFPKPHCPICKHGRDGGIFGSSAVASCRLPISLEAGACSLCYLTICNGCVVPWQFRMAFLEPIFGRLDSSPPAHRLFFGSFWIRAYHPIITGAFLGHLQLDPPVFQPGCTRGFDCSLILSSALAVWFRGNPTWHFGAYFL